MADDFKKYLAAEILSEQRTLTYRYLSRALKVHVHAAKCMLYDFYETQNSKKPGSVYATYLLSGIKKRPIHAVNGRKTDYAEDDHIPSSPPPFTSSMLESSQQSSQAGEEAVKEVPTRTITLVRQEMLGAVKDQYESISSVHIYSLSPAKIPDLVTLTDSGRSVFAETFVKEDPLQHYKTYGVIQNPEVRRRTGKRPVIPTGPAPKFQPVKDEPKPSKPSTTKSSAPAKNEESRPSSRDSTSTAASASKAKPATLKRDASDLFKAFAKQSQPKPKPSREDTPMKDAPNPASDDEGESEDEALFLDTNTHKPATSSKKRLDDATREKEERAAKLRKLMDSDDEAEPEVPSVEKASGLSADEPVAAQKGSDTKVVGGEDDDPGDEVAWSESDTDKARAPPPPQDPKRRRGKRKVMKKRTAKDEDGYLVTKEEAVWESFSEDEPEPAPASKPQLKSSQSQQTQGKAGPGAGAGAKKKGSAAAGGGGGKGIMSFFGKKNT
jgi:DNA polymerase delta subunit 3